MSDQLQPEALVLFSGGQIPPPASLGAARYARVEMLASTMASATPSNWSAATG